LGYLRGRHHLEYVIASLIGPEPSSEMDESPMHRESRNVQVILSLGLVEGDSGLIPSDVGHIGI